MLLCTVGVTSRDEVSHQQEEREKRKVIACDRHVEDQCLRSMR